MVRLPGKDSEKVFINCPYDDAYEPLFCAIIFGVLANGFIPRCAKEVQGSQDRLTKILLMIANCGYGIHDISRTEMDEKTKLPRFNMTFELGISIGCQAFDAEKKDFLILDTEQYRYRNFLSDLSGRDPLAHNNKPEEVLQHVNTWLGQKRIEKSKDKGDYVGSKSINDFFKEFNEDFPELCQQTNADINNLTHHELIYLTSKWLEKKKEMETIELKDQVVLKDSVEVKKIVKK